MKNQYLFIVWNKALFCENKIMNYLKKNFLLKKFFYVKWDKELFYENIMALYGTKAPDAEDKIKAIGKGVFLVIIVEDNNPHFEDRKTYNGFEKVNSKIYDAKWLFRKWTAGNFRVHSTQDDFETSHDLTVLFGANYNKKIDSFKNGEIIKANVKGIEGFDSVEDFKECLDKFNHSKVFENKENIVVFSKCRTDVLYFINQNNKIINEINFNNNTKKIIIFGEAEGDIPKGILGQEEAMIYICNHYKDYVNCIETKKNLSKEYTDIFEKYGLDSILIKKNPMRDKTKKTFTTRIKESVRYIKVRYLE